MNESILKLERVTKRFAGHTAVKDLSLEVPRGGIFGLLGPNGAGKTTTIRMIMNILVPDEGRVLIFGQEASGRDQSERIGFLPEERGLYKKMKVLDHLIFLAEAKGVSRRVGATKSKGWLDRLGMSDWANRKVEDLSKGMQQKVQFISTLLHDPALVILDEPFSGLDPVNSMVMKDVVVEIARSGRTVVFSTHIMEQAEKMCDHIAIIARGEKVLDGALVDIKRGFGKRNIALGFSNGGGKQATRILQDRTLVARVDDSGSSAEVELAPGADHGTLLRALVDAGVGLVRFEVIEPSLHSIFISKVGVEAATAIASEATHA
jgi:ABC-2 type transport system ATP-binding protein